ncbi:hypothetical protein A0H76_1297 [Hepatospora eriocheir]|uniref:Uncharacterized protein n=1 Tax=Hepatospora eriocheir TaxID=1081669 RepID=A0A1X0QHB5_9MICR|nr:hypothetical protein A0H76_1297 [Hepatospora eriocheir]
MIIFELPIDVYCSDVYLENLKKELGLNDEYKCNDFNFNFKVKSKNNIYLTENFKSLNESLEEFDDGIIILKFKKFYDLFILKPEKINKIKG